VSLDIRSSILINCETSCTDRKFSLRENGTTGELDQTKAEAISVAADSS